MPGRAVQRVIFLNRRHIKNILSLPLTLYDFEFLCIYKRIIKEKIKNIFFCGFSCVDPTYLAYLDLSFTNAYVVMSFFMSPMGIRGTIYEKDYNIRPGTISFFNFPTFTLFQVLRIAYTGLTVEMAFKVLNVWVFFYVKWFQLGIATSKKNFSPKDLVVKFL